MREQRRKPLPKLLYYRLHYAQLLLRYRRDEEKEPSRLPTTVYCERCSLYLYLYLARAKPDEHEINFAA